MRQQAGDRAYSLQQAHAQLLAAQGIQTPLAGHIAERLNMETQHRQAERDAIKTHLDGMLSKGQISDDQYQQAMAGVLSDSKELTAQAILQGNRPDPMQKPQFSSRVQMLRDQRKALTTELHQIKTARVYPLTSEADKAEGQVREEEIKKEMAENVAEDMKLTTGGGSSPTSAGTLSFNGKAVPTDAAPGSLSIRPAGSAAPATSSLPSWLPDPSHLEEGHTVGGSSGSVYEIRNHQWVPKTVAPVPVPQKKSAPGGITPAWQAAHPSSPQTDNPYLDAQGNAMVW
jgi:hypothetical protein